MSQIRLSQSSQNNTQYIRQSEKLWLEASDDQLDNKSGGTAVGARFVTPLDAVVETASGDRLSAVPVDEAHKLNVLKDQAERSIRKRHPTISPVQDDKTNGHVPRRSSGAIEDAAKQTLESAVPPTRTHPLFPPLPLYGPPSLLRDIQCAFLKITSFCLSTAFLAVIVLGALFTSIPNALRYVWLWTTCRDPNARRPFYQEELRRRALRKEQEKRWAAEQREKEQPLHGNGAPCFPPSRRPFEPLEGGPDQLVRDIRYYARRMGLDAEEFQIQTEDGFIISLFRVYDPSEYEAVPSQEGQRSKPEISTNTVGEQHDSVRKQYKEVQHRYPVLLVHGLLQSGGAYCTNDDDSLAFLLCKSGYDVWVGNNRCGFKPEHSLLQPHDPRMWAWNIRQMGVMDLPAMISRVLEETGFEKLGLVAHSQGTTQAFVVLAKEQRPELGSKISVFCALTPAVYAGSLIGKLYFKFMRVISPAMFRVFFGIHSFIPLMLTMHRILPGKLYGAMGYWVCSFLFDWSDERWDQGLRDRMFQFSPTYMSAESMRWWLGRECFAKHKCILATREEGQLEEEEDEDECGDEEKDMGRGAWFDEQVPPMALWVAGNDHLVDGRRLLRRFERGREPHVRVVHSKVIEEYEHLDVLWAMDAVEKVGEEVRQVLFDTMPEDAREVCRSIVDVERSPDEKAEVKN